MTEDVAAGVDAGAAGAAGAPVVGTLVFIGFFLVISYLDYYIESAVDAFDMALKGYTFELASFCSQIN